MTFHVRRLNLEDDRSTFCSDNADLDRFFVRYAGQNQFRHHLGVTYVAVDPTGFLAGFATLTPSEIAPEAMASATQKRRPKYPLPVLRLARLATDKRAQRQGVGSLLLRAMFLVAKQMADQVGCVGVVVDAKAEAIPFYETLGFQPLASIAGELGDRPICQSMFLEIGQLPKT